MCQLNEKNIVVKLLYSIPEIREEYELEFEWWDGEFPGLHNIFGDVFNPFLIRLIKNNNNLNLLKRTFEFLENMAISNDDNVKNVLSVTVLENLGDDKKILNKSFEYMGANTKKLSLEIEESLGRLK